jgi:hypothetical protein
VSAAGGENEAGESVAPYAFFQFQSSPTALSSISKCKNITPYFKICPPQAD